MLTYLAVFIITSACINALIGGFRGALKGSQLVKSRLWIRNEPLLPLELGALAGLAAMPSMALPEGVPAWVLVAAGVLAGALSGTSYKVAKQTIRGEDTRLMERGDG